MSPRITSHLPWQTFLLPPWKSLDYKGNYKHVCVMKYILLRFLVTFIPDQYKTHKLISICFGLLQPLYDVLKGVPSGDVVDYDGTCCRFII